MNEYWGAFVGYLPDYWRSAVELVAAFDGRRKASLIARAIRSDVSSASTGGRALILLAVATFLFEWGPLSEMTAAIVSLWVLAATSSALMAGLTGGLMYAGQQFFYGFVTALAIRHMGSGIVATREALNSQAEGGATRSDRLLLLIGFGASALIVNEHAREAHRPLRRDVALLFGALAVLGAIDVLVFWGATSAINDVGSDDIRSGIIDVATNPLTYIGIFVALKIGGFYRRITTAERPMDPPPIPAGETP